jgi:3-mercaptopyruvate sulfurtransferase SseA
VNTYCGGGQLGSIGILVLKLLGYENARSYVAGFSQWSRQLDTPVER